MGYLSLSFGRVPSTVPALNSEFVEAVRTKVPTGPVRIKVRFRPDAGRCGLELTPGSGVSCCCRGGGGGGGGVSARLR